MSIMKRALLSLVGVVMTHHVLADASVPAEFMTWVTAVSAELSTVPPVMTGADPAAVAAAEDAAQSVTQIKSGMTQAQALPLINKMIDDLNIAAEALHLHSDTTYKDAASSVGLVVDSLPMGESRLGLQMDQFHRLNGSALLLTRAAPQRPVSIPMTDAPPAGYTCIPQLQPPVCKRQVGYGPTTPLEHYNMLLERHPQ